MEFAPFAVAVPEEDLNDLARRLDATRWPAQLHGASWELGTDLDYLRHLCAYWREGFDWRAAERELNRWPQFMTSVDGQRLHLIHARSPVKDALPLVLTHGWPGSVFEFHKVIGPLTDPAAHGGDEADAFHVVCPSLPGYGWAGPDVQPGWDIRRTAQAEAAIMAGLGYRRYVAQGGDWGALASAHLPILDPEHVAGIHLSQVIALPPRASADSDDPADEAARQALTRFIRDGSGYSAIQSTRPQTLAYALTDSPSGLASWIVEKFRSWSDCGGDIQSQFTADELLTNIGIYWFSRTAGSAARLYSESARMGSLGRPPKDFVEVPTSCAIFPADITLPPRRWAENHYNVTRWTVMDGGGHFAALEEPSALVEDIRAAFRPLR